MNNGSYLKLFVDCLEKYQKLNDTEFGRLVRSALRYKATGEEPAELGREALLWDGMRLDIDRDNEKYTSTQESRSKAGKKGAQSRWQTQNEDGKNGKCHLPHGKNGYDKDKDKDKDQDQDQDQVVVVGKGIVSKEKKERPTTTTPALRAPVGVSVDGLEKIVSSYEACIGPIPRHVAEDAAGWISQGMDPELICKALELAAENNVRRWAYVQGILRNCQAGGISTLPAFLSREAERARDATEGARKPGAAEAQSKWPEL